MYDTSILQATWKEKGYLWFKTFAGSGGGEPFFDVTCARCFRSFWTPRGHRCPHERVEGIVQVNRRSSLKMKGLCERMAHIAQTESLYDGGIFGRSSWSGSAASGIKDGIFFIRFEDGFPRAYVIYNALEEGEHIVHHLFTVPYARRTGIMVDLLRRSLSSIGENQFTVYHREPIEAEALQLWIAKFAVDPTKYEFHRHWTRFKQPSE